MKECDGKSRAPRCASCGLTPPSEPKLLMASRAMEMAKALEPDLPGV